MTEPSLPPAPHPLAGPAFDSHCHLDAMSNRSGRGEFADASYVASCAAEASAVRVDRLINVGCAVAEWQPAIASTEHPAVFCALAVHPTEVGELTDAHYAELERLLSHPKAVAVGETGLDYYWNRTEPALQQEHFRRHIELAKRVGKALMIHDRDAHLDVLRVLDEEGAPDTVVFHCFSGDAAMARTCVDAGYVLSFAGPVTFKNAASLREAAALVPDGQLLVETDAPFLTPHPHRGRANEPYCLPWTVRGLAHVRGVSAERVADSARRTAEAVFGLPSAADAPSPGAGATRST